jgi:hypothetical protein
MTETASFVVRGQGGVKRTTVGSVVEDPADDGPNRACQEVATAAMEDDFTFNPIFLGGEGQGDSRSGGEVGVGSGEQGGAVNAARAQKKSDVGKAERGIVGGGPGILARPEKKEEGDHNHIGDSHCAGGGKNGDAECRR